MRALNIANDKAEVLSQIDFGDTAFSEIATSVGKKTEEKDEEGNIIQEAEADEVAVNRAVAEFLADRVYRHRRNEQRKDIIKPNFELK